MSGEYMKRLIRWKKLLNGPYGPRFSHTCAASSGCPSDLSGLRGAVGLRRRTRWAITR